MSEEKEDPFIAQARLIKILNLIELLRQRPWSAPELCKRFDVSKSTMQRYLTMLRVARLPISRDKQERYTIAPERQGIGSSLVAEEWTFIRKSIQAMPRTVARDTVLEKIVPESNQKKKTPKVEVKSHMSKFIEQLQKAKESGKQVMLVRYQSANSNVMSDRLIEPIEFGADYQTIFGLDTKDKKCKHFRLDRAEDIVTKRTLFRYTALHKEMVTDCFGYSGTAKGCITLRLTLRAYLDLIETYPQSKPYITKEKDHYIFSGPVFDFAGIGKYALSVPNDVKVIAPVEFKEYLLGRQRGATY